MCTRKLVIKYDRSQSTVLSSDIVVSCRSAVGPSSSETNFASVAASLASLELASRHLTNRFREVPATANDRVA